MPVCAEGSSVSDPRPLPSDPYRGRGWPVVPATARGGRAPGAAVEWRPSGKAHPLTPPSLTGSYVVEWQLPPFPDDRP